MSVDILIFDPAAVSDADFPAWWEEQSEWSEDHSDPNPAVTTPELQAFYADIHQQFPNMNGPDAPTDEELDTDPDIEDRLADYSIGTRLIYMAFPWSQAAHALTAVETIALRNGVAVARVSDDSSIQRP